jgi:hypothetical protein
VIPRYTLGFSVKTEAAISAPQVDPIKVEKIPSWSGVTEQVPVLYNATPPDETL